MFSYSFRTVVIANVAYLLQICNITIRNRINLAFGDAILRSTLNRLAINHLLICLYTKRDKDKNTKYWKSGDYGQFGILLRGRIDGVVEGLAEGAGIVVVAVLPEHGAQDDPLCEQKWPLALTRGLNLTVRER